MKVLLIEDDEYKAKQIQDFLTSKVKIPAESIYVCRAYQSGMESISKNIFDLILLDMSMPSFDVMPTRSPGRHRPYGGKDVLAEMKRKGFFIPTIIVTQFSIFGEGEERMDGNQLNELLEKGFPEMYLGMVHYNASMRNWKDSLLELIKTSGKR
jgi:CheY-like chemotaxis protein